MKKYKSESWVNSRVEMRASSLGGKGLFAKAPIKKGEVVMVFGGTVMTENDIKKGKYRRGTSAGIGEGSWYNNVHKDIFGKPDDCKKNDGFVKAIITETGKRPSPIALKKGDILEIHSYNDSEGIISPDAQKDKRAAFPMGTTAEVWVSDLKLKVVKCNNGN